MPSFFTSSESVPVPAWAAEKIGVSPDKVARTVVLCEHPKYFGFLRYIGELGVDINRDASKLPSDEAVNNYLSATVLGDLSDRCENYDDDTDEEEEDNSKEPSFDSTFFGLGSAHLQHDGKAVCFLDVALGEPINDERGRISLFRALHMFAESPQILRSFADDVAKWIHAKEYPEREKKSGKFDLYVFEDNGCSSMYWNCLGKKASRSLESIVLPKGTLDTIVNDFQSFTAQGTKSWYTLHGLPYRRSWLFYGPPGTGKTSTIRCLAGVLGLDTYFLSLGSDKVGNQELQSAIREMDKPAMLVIEDVDALFNEKRKSTNTSPLTFSGLLNALDGLVASEGGVLTVMTTNHKERLDPALIRAGRIDRAFEFALPNKDQIAKFFLSFYPDADEELAQKFADAVFSRPEKEAKSIATLQEHFIYTRGKSAVESCGLLDAFFSEVYPEKKEQEREFENRMNERKHETVNGDEVCEGDEDDEGGEGDE